MPASLPRRPVVIGTALNYDRATLAPFIMTCRRHVPEAAIVLFGSGFTPETLQWLDAAEVQVVFQDFNIPRHTSGLRLVGDQLWLSLVFRMMRLALKLGPNADIRARRAAVALCSVVTQRFYCYRHFLSSSRHRFSHVLLTDVRDVIFQANPFPCVGLHVFAENERIGDSHFARRWFTLSYGPRSWRAFQSEPLLNVGTTLGDTDTILQYLDSMCEEFDRRGGFFWGADTAMHNYVVHRGLVSAARHLYGEGAAINLNASRLETLSVKNGTLLDASGRPIPIVHQYDRVAGLQLQYDNGEDDL